MGILDKLAFWKHTEEEPDLPADLRSPPLGDQLPDLTLPAHTALPERVRPAEPSFEQQPVQPLQGGADLQLVLSKLDTIKAQLETINAKIDKLEHKDKVWR